MEEFLDNIRKITFQAGQRIHWFEYSRDGIIISGGFGTVVELELANSDVSNNCCWVHILCDDAKIRRISHQDVDLEQEWE